MGSIIFWSLSREPVSLPALVSALSVAGSSATPPEQPSDIVALHRAALATSKVLKLELHGRERGRWALVGKPSMEDDPEDPGASRLAYPVEAEAELLDGALVLKGDDRFRDLLRAEYSLARDQIASQDIGAWLCRKLSALSAVSLRPSGGFYFLPRPEVEKWEKLSGALKACSRHSVFAIPAMRSSDAVDAILQALTSDTQQACDKIAGEIGAVGKRALESRQLETANLLERTMKYESLLGTRLDSLRKAIEETRGAVATAMLTVGQDETEEG